MVPEEKIKEIVKRTLQELDIESDSKEYADISSIDLKTKNYLTTGKDLAALEKMKSSTSARIGVGRAGARYKTETQLRFRADHAVAMDAAFTTVSDDFLNEIDLFEVQTLCQDKDQYLTRPDLGKKLPEEALEEIKSRCQSKVDVQLIVGDGLSSTAIEANIKDLLPAIIESLKVEGITVGTPFFIKFARVASMEPVAKALDAKVTCILIGERPGLGTAESLSAYMAYDAKIGMPESKRNVVSNIHSGGTPPVEAGAYVASILKEMLKQKVSGLDLKI